MKYPTLPPEKDKRKKITPGIVKKMRSLRFDGHSDRTIGTILDLNHTTVRYHLNEAYRERKNKQSVERLKGRPFDAHRSDIQKRSRQHRIDVVGYDVVNAFERENRKETRHLHIDYRHTCTNKPCNKRYSYRKHNKCPQCHYPHLLLQ